MPNVIDRPVFSESAQVVWRFEGPYRFLSNFSPSSIRYQGYTWPTAEHLYQAMKANNWHVGASEILQANTPAEAKRIGNQVTLRPGWEKDKKQFMLEVLVKKFRQNSLLRAELTSLDGWLLVEGNTWGDQFWGCTYSKDSRFPHFGKNYLGMLLMTVRDIFIED